ncbi:MAG: hypothetical protein MG2_0850 [uncultured Candidatus Poseidoniales archaeon]|nr:MAG: hypothetical protein MG2_0850 [uncultured Candidatus Poseidoniales archaeon]
MVVSKRRIQKNNTQCVQFEALPKPNRPLRRETPKNQV